jgi:arylsulfatase A-like enzyme
MLQEIMTENGYYCAAFTAGGLLRTPGFERGFHEYYYSEKLGKVEDSFPQAGSWLKQCPRPFFLLLHTYEAHQPYTRTIFARSLDRGRLGDPVSGKGLFPPGWDRCTELEWNERTYIDALYDGGVRVACDAVADFFILMDELRLWEQTVVVVLSDHGEEFGEHFNVFGDHSHSLYQELLRVPLALYHPNMSHQRFVDDKVSLVDLVPTVAEILNLEWSGAGDGVDISPLLVGRTFTRPLPILASLSNSMEWEAVCLIQDGMKYIETSTRERSTRARRRDCVEYPAGQELYRLDVDPHEAMELSQSNPALSMEMAARLRDALARASDPIGSRAAESHGSLQPTLQNQLRALGYLEGE